LREPAPLVLTNKDDIDLVTGMVRHSGVPGQPAPA
jgi:hypothetical protein